MSYLAKPCCGGDPLNLDGEGCIPQKDNIRVIPSGCNKRPGQERMFVNASGEEMTRTEYNKWAKGLGFKAFDVVQAWYVDMKHGPIPEDLK